MRDSRRGIAAHCGSHSGKSRAYFGSKIGRSPCIMQRPSHRLYPLIGCRGRDRESAVHRHHAFARILFEPLARSAEPAGEKPSKRSSYRRQICPMHRTQYFIGGIGIHQIVETIDDSRDSIGTADQIERCRPRIRRHSQRRRPRTASLIETPPRTTMNISIDTTTIAGK